MRTKILVQMVGIIFAILLMIVGGEFAYNTGSKLRIRKDVKEMSKVASDIEANNLRSTSKNCIPNASFSKEIIDGLSMYDLTIWTCDSLFLSREEALSKKVCVYNNKKIAESISVGIEEALIVYVKIPGFESEYTDSMGTKKIDILYKKSDLKRDYKKLEKKFKNSLKKTLQQSRSLIGKEQ